MTDGYGLPRMVKSYYAITTIKVTTSSIVDNRFGNTSVKQIA